MARKKIVIVSIILLFIGFAIVLYTLLIKEKGVSIGVVLPLSGEGAKYGEAAKNAIDLVFKKVNDDGGIKGEKINLIYEDSRGIASAGVSATQKLISTSHVPAIIGDLFSSITLAMAPVVERSHVVLLSPTASAPNVTFAGDYVFRNCASDMFEGKIMAEAAVQRFNVNRVALVYVNNDYGNGIVDVFKKTFTSLNGKVVLEESFNQGGTDFRSQISKLKKVQYDAIYIVGYKELGQFLKQTYELGVKTQFFSTVMFEDPEILSIAGKAAEGVVYSARAYDVNSDDPIVKEFVSTYKKVYGSDPDIFAGYAYDAARIIVFAMQRGGFSSDEIKASLYEIKNFHGVTGATSFDNNGDVIQPAYLKTVIDNKFTWLH